MHERTRMRQAVAAAVVTALAAIALPASASTQMTPFTVDDVLGVVNVNVADVSDDGQWVAATGTTLRRRIGVDNHRFGDPTYISPLLADVWVIHTRTGKSHKLFPEPRQVRSLRWSPDGARLALLVLNGERFEPVVWDREANRLQRVSLPNGRYAAENAGLQWSKDGSELIIGLRSDGWLATARERFERETRGPVVVLSSKQPFLSWEELRRMSSVRSLIAVDLKSGRQREILPEMKLSSYNVADDGTFISYTEDITPKTDYDVIFGTENKVQMMPFSGGEPRTIIKSTKGINPIWSRDGRRYAYAKEGSIFVGGIDEDEPRQLTGKKPEKESGEPKPKDEDDKKKEAERFSPVRLSPSGDRLVATNKQGMWLIDTSSGEREHLIKVAEDDRDAPRHQVIDWSADGKLLYLSRISRTSWERAIVRYDVAEKRLIELFKETRILSGVRLSKDGGTFVFSLAEGNRPGDLFASDSEFRKLTRLTEANQQLKSKKLSRTELVSYLDVDGKRLNGVLYYPVDYEPGKKYPTVFNVYEQFFDDNFSGTINVLTNAGYAVMQPSVEFETGFPGEAWMKGVTAAANKVIEMGVADPDRLGVQGTSYGGYATNLLITQTSRFKAAINISGKVNMVSFYTDSPRLGVRNVHAPEKSQDRIGATLWQQPQKYIQHSAIMFADRIKTPLLLITGEQDHNVPARQAMEMYYALRRLGKEVEWVNYVNGGHGMPTTSIDEVKDYHARIVGWYDRHLKVEKKTEEKEEPPPQQ